MRVPLFRRPLFWLAFVIALVVLFGPCAPELEDGASDAAPSSWDAPPADSTPAPAEAAR